jgi:GTP-binding protein Era
MSFRSGFVTLVGRPNTGKSTLLNTLLDTKVSIVSPRPQTTRTRLQGVLAQVVFVDTPGTHRPMSRMNEQMMRSVKSAMDGIDLLLVVVDSSRSLNDEDALAVQLASRFSGPSFLVLNKIDLIDKKNLLPLIDHARAQHKFLEYIPVSARTGENRQLLEEKTLEHLPEGPPLFPPDALTDQPTRFLAAEMIREKIFYRTREEIPYSTAVVIDSFEEPDPNAPVPTGPGRKALPLIHIQATILVEREGQKGIIIGARGQRLKQIGEAARVELESFLNARVFLELFVKTREDWRGRAGVEQLIDWRHG